MKAGEEKTSPVRYNRPSPLSSLPSKISFVFKSLLACYIEKKQSGEGKMRESRKERPQTREKEKAEKW